MKHFHVTAGLVGSVPCHKSFPIMTRDEARADLADQVEIVCLVLSEENEEYLLDQAEHSPDYVDFAGTGTKRWEYIEVIVCCDPHCLAETR